MAVVTKTVLKSYFEDGKEPDENKYIDLIDTMSIVDGVTDHGALSGLGDDDHSQYLLADGSRNLTGDLTITDDLLVQDDVVVKGGLITGITTPPFTVPNGTLFLHDDAVNDYGFQSAEGPWFASSNTFYTGAEWRTIKAGTSATLYISYSSGLMLRTDATSRSAGGLATHTNRFSIDLSGNAYLTGGLYIGSSTAVTTAGRLKIAETLYTGGGIVLGYVSGAADADGIRMFHGTTLRGDIETQNSTWLRFNTHAASDVYTPRSMTAAGTLTAGSSAKNSTGDLSYTGNLRPYRASAWKYGYVYVPIQYNNGVGWTGAGRSTSGPSSITVSSVFTSVPSTAKAVNLRMIARDSAGHIQTNLYFGVGATSANPYDLSVHPVGNDHQMENQGIVNILTANTIYYRIAASGGSTMDCWLVCMGYWI